MTTTPQDWGADFAVFSPEGQLAAVAEAKKKPDVGPIWAAAWLRNYLGRHRGAPPPFVILATPDKIYVWKQPSAASPAPTLITDARRTLQSYLPASKASTTVLSSQGFEFVVGAWLNDLSHDLWQPPGPDEIAVLRESGLLQAVAHGRVVPAIAA